MLSVYYIMTLKLCLIFSHRIETAIELQACNSITCYSSQNYATILFLTFRHNSEASLKTQTRSSLALRCYNFRTHRPQFYYTKFGPVLSAALIKTSLDWFRTL